MAGSWRRRREYAVVSENCVTPVPASIDRTSAPLLGCAVTTALGVVNNDAQIAIGEAVVVFGAGGVGLNIVQFAAMAGAGMAEPRAMMASRGRNRRLTMDIYGVTSL
ncbi:MULTISPECIES: hypothetical protein [Bradyrhizobium]|uniref:Alcohol dehydrogenase-like C-terminal domain-containing protein n=1 Tax=Bradyrhizobium vignae TaxID=1549949 RepID=A0A2U3QCM4_9BRAD|nr:hypothetical protein [Bradyrhizobium vignae]SPP99100.1 protein of unknown function [Bradyrhizobium vignae]